MNKNFRIEKQGFMSSMLLTKNPVDSRTVFSSFDDAKQALLSYADRVIATDK